MKLKTSLQIFFILILPSLVYAQKNAVQDFSAHVLDKGLGKVVVGDIDNDGINDLIRVAGLKGESMVLFKFDRAGNYKKYPLVDKINFRGDRLALYDIDRDGDLDLMTGIGNNDAS